MAHVEQLAFVNILSTQIYEHRNFLDILEIGSYDVNGSIRQYFKNSNYIGVDLIEGKGVDVIGDGHILDYPDERFDMVISCESFEHNPYWKETFLNMIRMTKKGGLVVFTCATTDRPEHGTTRTSSIDSPGTIEMNWDYYKNLEKVDFIKEIPDFNHHFNRHLFMTNSQSKDLYFIGIKSGDEIFPVKFYGILKSYLQFRINQKISHVYIFMKKCIRFGIRTLKGN